MDSKTAVACAVVLITVGCAEDRDPRTEEATIRFQLLGDGEALTLEGTPEDSDYMAAYANPRGLTRMDVAVSTRGQLHATCQSADGDSVCSEPPFLPRVDRGAAGSFLRVWDLHGVLVAQRSLGVDPCGSANPACGVQDHPVRARAGICDDLFDSSRQRMCEGINDRLEALGLDYGYDCDRLDELFDPSGLDGVDEPETDLGCDDILDSTVEALEEEVEDADCSEVEDAIKNWETKARADMYGDGICGSSPLILDLDGDGVALTAVSAGPMFDLLGDGQPVRTAWISGDDAFLALDRDGNGTIDGAGELFGNATAGLRFNHGFAALSELDANADGRIDDLDPAWASLRVWRDADHSGTSQLEELTSLGDVGIASIDLQASVVRGPEAWDAFGSHIPLVGSFGRTDGSTGRIVDAYLRFSSATDRSARAGAE